MREELGVGSDTARIIGAYGGTLLENIHLNGDHVGHTAVVYLCSLDAAAFAIDEDEVLEIQ